MGDTVFAVEYHRTCTYVHIYNADAVVAAAVVSLLLLMWRGEFDNTIFDLISFFTFINFGRTTYDSDEETVPCALRSANANTRFSA